MKLRDRELSANCQYRYRKHGCGHAKIRPGPVDIAGLFLRAICRKVAAPSFRSEMNRALSPSRCQDPLFLKIKNINLQGPLCNETVKCRWKLHFEIASLCGLFSLVLRVRGLDPRRAAVAFFFKLRRRFLTQLLAGTCLSASLLVLFKQRRLCSASNNTPI